MESFGLTDIGKVRNINQDAFFSDNKKGIFIVADGMGGHAGGEIASKMCIDTIKNGIAEKIVSAEMEITKVRMTLVQITNQASTLIYERALEHPDLRGMGTTATCLIIRGDQAFFSHVGDSRCYLFRQKLLYQLTEDHSFVQEQIKSGVIDEEQASSHYLRNVITRSVGYQEEEEVDSGNLKIEKDDIFLLCSDGLYGKVSDEEIADYLKFPMMTSASKLVSLANARGGEDNITIVLVKI